MRVDLLWALDALLTGSVLFLSGFALRHHVTLSRMRQEAQTAQRELELFRRGTAADEFFLIVERCRIEIAVQRAEQILVSLRTLGLTASIGVAEWDGLATQTCEQMECDAEQAMHCAKLDGRNCVRSCSVIEHTVPAAVPVEISTEQTQRHAA